MNHQPTQLALLISLIGVGVSPCANASVRVDDRASGAVQSLPGLTCDELEAASMQICGTTPDRVWQLPRSTLDLPVTAGVRLLYSAPRDDWAPGESPDGPGGVTNRSSPRAAVDEARPAVVQAAAKPVEAREAPRSTTRKQASGKTRKMRTIAKAPSPARVNAKSLAGTDAAIERIERIELVEKAEPKRADPAVAESALSEASNSAQSERLLDNLVPILREAPAAAAPVVAESAATPADDAGRTEVRARLREATQAQIERPPIVVESQASVVLRSLGAILSEERDEVGAIRPEATDAAVTSQTGKVIAMLDEIATAPPAIEDGPTRRLRKLAARAAKIEAAATADAEAAAVTRSARELAAEIAENGVDLMLPLEPPVVATELSANAAEMPLLTEPPPIAAPAIKPVVRAARAKPFGDRQVAVSETSLDRVRGGFAFDGLNISFGIERAVYVNGALVTTTSLNVSDLGRITAGTGTGSFDIRSMGLVQSGAGNVLSPTSVSAGSISTVVQNTLDGQKIQNVTVINATVNSLGVLKGLNLQSSLRGAVIDSLRR